MKPFLFLIALCMLLAGSLRTVAQSGHVYEDSSILYPQETEAPQEENPVVAAPVTDDNSNEEIEGTYERDTFLINNRHFLSPDSLRLLRNEKHFYYASNLDSLLKDLKKRQEAKTKAKEKDDIDEPVSKGPTKMEAFFNSKATQYFLWGLAALFVLFVLYKLFFAGGAFERSTAKSNVKIIDEEEAKPVQERNFDAAIARAVSENNYRLAVRYMYLQLLQRLAAAGAIEFAVDKTNAEYLGEITGKPYKAEVAELTRYYDYVWYGEFVIDAAAYSKLAGRFKDIVI
jgi:hypothetical protein